MSIMKSAMSLISAALPSNGTTILPPSSLDAGKVASLPASDRAEHLATAPSKVDHPDPNVSILNFHYCSPPDAVAMNFGLKRVIGFDETGFRGVADLPYRTDAWDFLMAGGAVYSNLDYSYSVAHPDGTAKVTTSPGGGGPELRKQLAILKEFMDGLDFVHMKPDNGVVKGGAITSR